MLKVQQQTIRTIVTKQPNDTQHPAEVSITILERKTRRNKPRPRLNATVPGRDEGRLLNAHHLVSDPRARQYDVRLGVNQARLAQQISEVKLNVERWGRNEDMSVTPQ